jgi:hypothetical protein
MFMSKADSHWKKRVLCSDGNCIGIIGDDGRCKECGLAYDGELPTIADASDALADSADDARGNRQPPEADDQASEELQENADASDDGWEDRTLCIDESCIGVVGPDGRCKECGRPYDG